MKPILVPKSYNYISAFLTFKCSFGCSYCINHSGDFKPRKEMTGEEWVEALRRIPTREDLPITLSGGEPTEHPDFYNIIYELDYGNRPYMDLLTNGSFNLKRFDHDIGSHFFKRKAPYASIRFSFHKNTDETELLNKVYWLKMRGYSVGIWMINHPDMLERNKELLGKCIGFGIDCRGKDFLDENYKGYKYLEYSTGSIDKCLCLPSEMLIAPDGYIFRCHRDLYSGIGAYAHVLDYDVKLLKSYKECVKPKCNFCDLKIKFDRFQKTGHCAVEIKDV